MEPHPRQRHALEEICDTFCPSGDGLPSARELGVADAMLAAVARNPRASERKQLATLLSLWDTRALGALGGAGLQRFSALPGEQRERVLLAWADSRAAAAARGVPGAAQGGAAVLLHAPRPGRRRAIRPGTRSATTGRSGRCPTRRPRR